VPDQLLNTDVSKIKMDYFRFKLYFPDSVAQYGDTMRTFLPVREDEKEALFESLLANFKNRGQLESLELLDVDYRQYQASKHWYSREAVEAGARGEVVQPNLANNFDHSIKSIIFAS
jgi:hypothetical protein